MITTVVLDVRGHGLHPYGYQDVMGALLGSMVGSSKFGVPECSDRCALAGFLDAGDGREGSREGTLIFLACKQVFKLVGVVRHSYINYIVLPAYLDLKLSKR